MKQPLGLGSMIIFSADEASKTTFEITDFFCPLDVRGFFIFS